jgi:hypothetical protein
MTAEGTGREWASAAGTAWRGRAAFSEMAPRISQITRERNAHRIICVAAIVAGHKKTVNWQKSEFAFVR